VSEQHRSASAADGLRQDPVAPAGAGLLVEQRAPRGARAPGGAAWLRGGASGRRTAIGINAIQFGNSFVARLTPQKRRLGGTKSFIR